MKPAVRKGAPCSSTTSTRSAAQPGLAVAAGRQRSAGAVLPRAGLRRGERQDRSRRPTWPSRLDDELYALNDRLGEGTFPKAPKAYLDDWAGADVGWLRKYYPPGSDEPHFDATPAVERALGWVESLQVRSFVGTESRLNTVFELLRQMAFGAETDPDVRLAELHRRRDEIDADIDRVRAGHVEVLDDAGAARPVPAVLRHGQGVAGRFPSGRGQFPPARSGTARTDRRLDRLQGRTVGRRSR